MGSIIRGKGNPAGKDMSSFLGAIKRLRRPSPRPRAGSGGLGKTLRKGKWW